MKKYLNKEEYPHLFKQWHTIKNENLKLEKFTYGSNKKFWWKCSVAEDHEWKSAICDRTINGNGCPCCCGKKVVKSNCLATTHPEIAKEWHLSLNNNLTPNNVTKASHKKVWWICSKNHEYESIISKRTNNQNCPYCSNHKINNSNCLAATNPKLAKEWHPTKNGSLTPNNVTKRSSKKIWWICSKNPLHIWQASCSNRKTTNCPYCNNKKVWEGNCLATTNPEIIKEWHPTKNKNLTPNNIIGGHRKIWRICSKNPKHIWRSVCSSRKKGTGCPYCNNKKAWEGNCLAATNPEIAKEWHPTLNNNLTPNKIISGSNKKIWWMCSKNPKHIWKTSCNHRKAGQGCPVCNESKGEKIISNYLIYKNLKFKRQKRFKSCYRYKHHLLPFDFIVYYNNKILLMEYQGKQHYLPHNFGSKTISSIESLKDIQHRDFIKRNWCIKNNIPLLEIPYTTEKENVPILIENFLKN